MLSSASITTASIIAVCNGKIVGLIDIRHTLNQFLREYGGNIGYSVRPSERNKGYATEILKQGLEYCKTIHLKKVMLACNKDNKASSRTIEKCGGVLEREFIYLDGKTIQVYWIVL
jgi:predicted acetyltransferase